MEMFFENFSISKFLLIIFLIQIIFLLHVLFNKKIRFNEKIIITLLIVFMPPIGILYYFLKLLFFLKRENNLSS